MIIGVAGPYSASSPEHRQRNLDALNIAAAQLVKMGHVPLIGVNAALPVVQILEEGLHYDTIIAISLALIDKCDALLMLGESPGANRERDLVLSKGLSVYYSIDEIPSAK